MNIIVWFIKFVSPVVMRKMMVKRIKLTKNKFTIIDCEDYEYLNQWNWYASEKNNGIFYATRTIKKNGVRKEIYMHKVISKIFNSQVDHINRNTLDNRKSNLRKATRSQNQANTSAKKRKNRTSTYKGVYKHAKNDSFISQIRVNNKTIYLGSFSNELDAAKTYNEAAKKYFGEFAKLNESQK